MCVNMTLITQLIEKIMYKLAYLLTDNTNMDVIRTVSYLEGMRETVAMLSKHCKDHKENFKMIVDIIDAIVTSLNYLRYSTPEDDPERAKMVESLLSSFKTD